jgi:hypothetical protein
MVCAESERSTKDLESRLHAKQVARGGADEDIEVQAISRHRVERDGFTANHEVFDFESVQTLAEVREHRLWRPHRRGHQWWMCRTQDY